MLYLMVIHLILKVLVAESHKAQSLNYYSSYYIVNDMVSCSSLLQFILFADNTNLFLSVNSLSELMVIVNTEFTLFTEWFHANLLSVNVTKTKYILFAAKHKIRSTPCFAISIDGNILDRINYTKFLGVYIDKDLN